MVAPSRVDIGVRRELTLIESGGGRPNSFRTV